MTDPTHGQASRPEDQAETERWERDKAATRDHGQQHEQGETVRAAQIQAVRDVMGVGRQPDDLTEQAVADTAAEVVDAVLAAGDRIDHAACISALDMAEGGLDQAHAAGYAAARRDAAVWMLSELANGKLDDPDTGVDGAVAKIVKYLEAVGPTAAVAAHDSRGVDQPTTETPEPVWRVGRHLGRTLYRSGVVQGMLDDPRLTARIAELLNADEAAPNSTPDETVGVWPDQRVAEVDGG